MLNKKNKLTTTDEFSSVFSKKKRLTSSHFFLHYSSNEYTVFRLGCIVPKKIEKRAVKRNYIKRSISEIFQADFPSGLAVDIVLRVKKTFDKTEFFIIKDELKSLFLKIKA